jgi:16S rRNA (guanine(966)-N(2))-methyltransferase RsmD
MRIISGIHKGRRLTAPKNLPVRPTTDNAKEALFNILNNRFHFDQLEVLDLFSGTGNISFEFASRGVPGIICVDSHPGCVKFIYKTAHELSLPITTIRRDVFKYLDGVHTPFDIIFADPPYAFEIAKFEEIVRKIMQNGLLKQDGVLILEHPKQTDLSELPGFEEFRKYGSSVFSFFKM